MSEPLPPTELTDTQQLRQQRAGLALAEAELRRSELRFRELFESSPDAIFVEDLAGNVLDVNRSACELHALKREELVGKNAIHDLVPPASRAAAAANFQKLVDGQVSWIEGESRRADGRSVPVEIRVVKIEFDARPALLFHVRDLTARRNTEVALRSSESLFHSVWDNSLDGMRLTDKDGIIIAVNRAFCQLVGLTAAQLEGQPFTIIYGTNANAETMLKNHRHDFSKTALDHRRERDFPLHDGRAVRFEISDSFVESGGNLRLLLSIFRDITMQRRLEDQLRQSQKMEAIGQLAGGIAHDFNNILTVILGHASLLAMSDLDEDTIQSARQIKHASERAAALTSQLLAFGRKQIFNPRPVDLNRILGKMSDMIARLVGEDIDLQLNFSGEPALVEADTSMMEQVVLNLSVNSRDAMPKGGEMKIRIAHREITEAQARHSAEARAGRFVCLSHTDTGGGIPPENISRIFEPFFTTKELGKGTGLGLATVYGIVKQHHGWIDIESTLGHGTTFHIFLPATTTAAVEPEHFDTQFRARGGAETILVVEDERDLREMVARTLNRQGYRVFQAVDGPTALDIWEKYRDQISLVFSDVVMPGGMNGRELAERIWKDKPAQKIIFSTGYGTDALGKDFHLDPQLNYLPKPYLPQQLALLIRRYLDVE